VVVLVAAVLVVATVEDPADPLVVVDPDPAPPVPPVVLEPDVVPPVVEPTLVPVVAELVVPDVVPVSTFGLVVESSPAHAASVTRRTLGPRA
jgi:hypothetical protein